MTATWSCYPFSSSYKLSIYEVNVGMGYYYSWWLSLEFLLAFYSVFGMHSIGLWSSIDSRLNSSLSIVSVAWNFSSSEEEIEFSSWLLWQSSSSFSSLTLSRGSILTEIWSISTYFATSPNSLWACWAWLVQLPVWEEEEQHDPSLESLSLLLFDF